MARASVQDSNVVAADFTGYQTLTPSKLTEVLGYLTSADNGKPMANVMVWGCMGIGKTEIIRAIAASRNMRVVSLHLPQFDPTDIKGIPVRMEDGAVRWVASSYLPQKHVVEKFQPENSEITFNFPAAEFLSVMVYQGSRQVASHIGGKGSNGNGITINNPTSSVTVSGVPAGARVVIEDRAILFLDELSAAVPEVQNAALQLVLDRRVGEYELPSNCPVVAAGNRESDGAFVNQMSAPLANRFCHLVLVPSVTDFLNWGAEHDIDASILGYIRWVGTEALLKFDEGMLGEGRYGFRTPRSWAMLSHQLKHIPANMDDKLVGNIVTGFIGIDTTLDFMAYRHSVVELVDTDDILDGKVTSLGRVDIGVVYGLGMALSYKLRDRSRAMYNPKVSPKDQSPEWGKTCENLLKFLLQVLGPISTEIVVMMLSLLPAMGVKIGSLSAGQNGKKNQYLEAFSHEFHDFVKGAM